MEKLDSDLAPKLKTPGPRSAARSTGGDAALPRTAHPMKLVVWFASVKISFRVIGNLNTLLIGDG